MAEAMTVRRCRVEGTITDAVAYRAARIDAEEEATAKLLALKSERARLGRWPPPSPAIGASRCAENVWQYQTDGASMSLRMSNEPAWEPSARIVPQLDFRY